MQPHPLISVLIPTYNREIYLREAVASVWAQTYATWELLVVDDGSTDGTRGFLESLAVPRVRGVWRPHCGNAATLRNAGAELARGSYVAWLDSDDAWLPDKLARQVAELVAHPDCGWVYSDRLYVDGDGREIPWLNHRPWVPHGGWILEPVLDVRARIATSSVVVERSLLQAIGGFDETVWPCEDNDLWIRLAEASPAAVVAAPLIKKRIHGADRHADRLVVQSHMNRIYGGFVARAPSARLRRLGRRQRARVNLDIVGMCRRAGDYRAARRALWTAFSVAGWQLSWWAALAKTLIRPAIPRALLTRYARSAESRPLARRESAHFSA